MVSNANSIHYFGRYVSLSSCHLKFGVTFKKTPQIKEKGSEKIIHSYTIPEKEKTCEYIAERGLVFNVAVLFLVHFSPLDTK